FMLKISYLSRFPSVNKAKNDFRLITFLIFSLSIVNIVYKFDITEEGVVSRFNLWNPSWLLFGPLLYCAYRSLINKPVKVSLKHGLHLIPFLFFSIYYIFVVVDTDMSDAWSNSAFTYYQNSYLIIAFSLLPYSIYVLSNILKVNTAGKQDADALVISLSAIYILVCLVLLIMVVGWRIFLIDMGFDYRYLSYGLLLFGNLIIGLYWLAGDKKTIVDETEDFDVQPKSYTRSALTQELAIDYKERISSYFEYTNAFLDPNVTIDFLSKELGIPKHYFSQVFNIYFEKSFHSFVAEYRILHALDLINANQGRLKIESLAYSCGFNSKTSFNKYFKEKTGFTPSEYQLQQEKQTA
ncbi:MAG: AraC family transcriptional regulator, partial [Pedobacter sp.]